MKNKKSILFLSIVAMIFFLGGFISCHLINKFPDPSLIKLKFYRESKDSKILVVDSFFLDGTHPVRHGPNIKLDIDSLNKDVVVFDKGIRTDAYKEFLYNSAAPPR